MANEPTNTPTHDINGGDPTDQEALLASQVNTIGDNPQEEPAAAPPAAEGDGPAAAPAPAPAPAPAVEVEDPPAVAPAATTPEPTSPPPAPAAIPAPAKPEPPRDFDQANSDLLRRYDDGDIDAAEFQKQQRELSKEESAFTARLTVWEENMRSAAEVAQAGFNAVAVAWERDNAEFLKNPLRRNQMQVAIEEVDRETGGRLSPQQLFERAGQVAFEAFGWQPKESAVPAIDPAKAIADAVARRTPPPAPQTLAAAPAAAPIDSGRNAAYETLDSKNVSDLEDALARMSADQREAYLRDAPGAMSTTNGRE